MNFLYELLNTLNGNWQGEGYGEYPNMARFEYFEELHLEYQSDWNMLVVIQRTWQQKQGKLAKPLHLESGIILPNDDGTLTYSCGQDGGRSEVMVGTLSNSQGRLVIDWITTSHANDERLIRMGRVWTIDGDQLSYEAFLSTLKTPDYRKHLEARLVRQA